ncbi:MAG: phytanoyl-CoA dioxygenase family protein [Pseudomonadota bacterium]
MLDTDKRLASSYERDGFVFPIRVMAENEADEYRTELQRAEAMATNDPDGHSYFREYSNVTLGFVDQISRLPAITDRVAALLGEDLLVMACSFFIKEAKSPAYVSWHQDLHYWGLDGDEEVTAWVALSSATRSSGAMRFVPGSHRESVAHKDTFADDNLLTRGQEIAVEVDDDDAVTVELAPGEMSLHHGRLFHASDPNRTGDRRIGLAIRYVPTRMTQEFGGICATLVRGQDRFGNFTLVDGGERTLAPEDLLRHRQIRDNRRQVLMRKTG